MEASILLEFMKKTGCDTETGHMFLQAYKWDLKNALDVWYQNQAASETVDKSEAKKLARGISRAADNEYLVHKARDAIAKDFENNRLCKVSNFCVETPETSFSLPDITLYYKEFREFLEKDLIEKSVMMSLESSGKLNWWCNQLGYSNRLWPLSTTGDGNCLLHAASLSMYGFHDRLLTLRNALYGFITNSTATETIKRRWRWQQTKSNLQSGVQYSEDEWEKEWEDVVNMASARKRKDYQGSYESLEEIHILFLANILRRVIIVISETVLKDSYNQPLSPIHFGGIYIPFEIDEKKCYRSPLLLTYDMAHFSALVFMERDNTGKAMERDNNGKASPSSFCIPVVDSQGNLLPIQFSIDPGLNFNWDNFSSSDSLHAQENNKDEQVNLLKVYLDIIDVWSPANSPENESEDEIERHYIECSDQTDGDANNIFNKKNKAAKQLEILGKQFGSIGKSMSKKLKQNFGSLTKLAAAKPKKTENAKWKFLCVEIYIKRHAFQNEMIQNYMKFAEERFIRKILTQYSTTSPVDQVLKEQAVKEGLVKCINSCEVYATAYTCYMCSKCFENQKKQEQICNAPQQEPYFGIGKSKFYREPDMASYEAVKNLSKTTNVRPDRTLYLSHSTFFNDTGESYNNNNNIIDLNQNFNDISVSDDKENEVPRPRSKSIGQKVIIHSISLPPKEEVPVEQLITEFDFGQIPIPESIKKSLDKPKNPPTSMDKYPNSIDCGIGSTQSYINSPLNLDPDVNLNVLTNRIQSYIQNDSLNRLPHIASTNIPDNNQPSGDTTPFCANIKTESDL